jgi:hypothetical protein
LQGGLTPEKSESDAGRRGRRVGWQQKNQREIPDIGAGGLADNRKISQVTGVYIAAVILLLLHIVAKANRQGTLR